jgi:hypothetical protein
LRGAVQGLLQEDEGSPIRLDMKQLFFRNVTGDDQGFLFLHDLPKYESHPILT